ncbi:MAG: secretin N-terminal domain-containing protein [Planctomycetota bacterium]
MRPQRSRSIFAAQAIAAMLAVSGLAASAAAFQDAAQPAPPQPAAQQPQSQPATPAATQAPADVRFAFSDTPFAQVLDVFSRETGLPIIRETDPPGSTFSFVSGSAYPFEQALSIVNLAMQRHGVRLRLEDDYLFLSSINDAARKEGPVIEGEFPADITPDQIVTLIIPLDNSRASDVAERIKPLIASYGSITPVDRQNMLILVESAGQAERIRGVVGIIDAVKPVDSEYRLFPLTHARAREVLGSLRGLVGERVREVFIDKDGRRTEVEKVDISGLNIQADNRTNSIIAVGPRTRLETVEELLNLLDRPSGGAGGDIEMVTFQLEAITPQDAANNVNQLFAELPRDSRPKVLPLPSAGKLTIVGAADLVARASMLLVEVDPGLGRTATDAPREFATRTIALDNTDAARIEQTARRMLTPRQLAVLRFTPTPAGDGILVSGPSLDVEAFTSLAQALDAPPERDTTVRLLELPAAQAAELLDIAQTLDSADAEDDPVATSVDAEGSVILTGSRQALDRFENRLREAGGTLAGRRSSRMIELDSTRPSQLAPRLTRLAQTMLQPAGDPIGYQPPVIEAVDELSSLIVRATPDQHRAIETLAAQLESATVSPREIRVVPLPPEQASDIKARADELYQQLTLGMSAIERGTVEPSIEPATGSVLLVGDATGVRRYADILRQAQQLIPAARQTRVFDVRNTEASTIVEPLRELLAAADPISDDRALPEPTIVSIERTNALLITAEPAQLAAIEPLVRRLDVPDPQNLPPLKILQLRTADANTIASMLNQQYSQRPQADRSARPVNIRADAATNTLIVSAHTELFDDIKAFVDELNVEDDEPERTTKLFPLKVARAADVAQAMDKLYPEPPIPLDSRGRPMFWLREPKEVTVSADASSNALIIDAPTERISDLEELAAQLDRVQVPPRAELRTYRVIKGDLNVISRTLQSLAGRGVLSAPAQAGQQQVRVLIEAEPNSNTLIVAGDDITFQETEKVLERLEAVETERQLTIVPIASLDAATVRERALTIYNAQTQAIDTAGRVDVTVDPATNSLEIVAAPEDAERFVAVLNQLQQQAGPAREARLIELRLAKASDVAEFMRELVAANENLTLSGGPVPAFEPIEATNAILVAAIPEQFPIIDQLIRQLDNEQQAERPPLRILRLRTSDAGQLSRVLQQSYDRRAIEERTAKPVSISSDAATNTLVVSAHVDVLPEIEAIVSQLNEAQTFDADGRSISIFPLKHARAEELATTIDAMYTQPPAPYDPRLRRFREDLRAPKEITVRADRATNSLIVDAPAGRLAEFEQIVRQLDQADITGDVDVRTYRVPAADVDAVARALQDLARSGALPTGSRTPVQVSVERNTRTIVVSGPTAVFETIERVVADISEPPESPTTVLRLYPLKFARAERLQPILSELLISRLREAERLAGRDPANADALLTVSADPQSNALIVSAPEPIQAIADQLIQTLDTESSAAGARTIRVYPLQFAAADAVAQTVTAVVPSMDLPVGDVRVVAAAGSNALVLSGVEADLVRVEELIEPLDVKPDDEQTAGVETFALEHADAARIAQTVERLLAEQRETDPRLISLRLRSRAGAASFFDSPKVRVEAEPRTNSLIVSAPLATLELAGSIIERLDRPTQQRDFTTLTYTPAKTDASQLAADVQRIADATLPQGRDRAEVFADAATGSVTVIGPAESVAEIETLLRDRDASSFDVPQAEFAILPLTEADAGSLAAVIQDFLSDRSRWPDVLRRAERAGLDFAEPRVRADSDSNRVIVSAPSPLMPMAREIVASFDQPRTDASVELRVFSLVQGDAESVASTVRAALESQAKPGQPVPVVTAEPSSNTVLVAATPATLQAAEAIVAQMDVSVEPAATGVRTVFLKHARAEALAPIVERVLTGESLLDGVPSFSRGFLLSDIIRRSGGRGLPDGIAAPALRVVPEPRMNALIVSAPATALELAEQVIAELDQPTDPGDDSSSRPVRIIALKNSDARELADNLTNVFTAEDDGSIPPTIGVDASANALIVRANRDQLTTIEQLAGELDAAALVSSRELRRIPIDRSRADAELMASTLRSLLGREGDVSVRVITVDELLQDDEPVGEPESRAPAMPLRWRVLSDIVAVTALSAQAEAAQTTAGDDPDEAAQADITIAVDPATNSLIVVGSPRLADRVAELAATLEDQLPAQPTGVSILELPAATDADAVRQIVQQAVSQIGRASESNPGGLTGRVGVAADPTGTALIVFANDTDFAVVRRLVASVVRVEAADAVTLKIYPLSNISAFRASSAIRDLLSPQPRGRQARQIRGLDVTLDLDGTDVAARIDPARVSITADPGGTSIIVAAPAEAMGLIDSLVGVLDQSPVRDRLAIRRYELEHAEARTLTGVFQQLFDAQRQGPGANDVPRVRFISDRRTNSVLVTASATQHEEVERLLATADVELELEGLELRLISIDNAPPSAVQRIIERIVIGRDPGKAERVLLSSEDQSGLLVVRAGEDDLAEIERIVAEVDQAEIGDLPVRTVKLERADAQQVAQSLQQFFREREQASRRAGRRAGPGVAITGDRQSGTLIIAASDEDFEQLRSMAETFDSPAEARGMQFRVIPLTNIRTTDIEDTIEQLAGTLSWQRFGFGRGSRFDMESGEEIYVSTNEALNAVILFGEGTTFERMISIVAELDVPQASDAGEQLVRAVRVRRGDLDAIAEAVEEALEDPNWQWWRGRDPEGIALELDEQQRTIYIIGREKPVDRAVALINELDEAAGDQAQTVASIRLSHADAGDAARSLDRFFLERARAEGLRSDSISIFGSDDGNVLIVSADDESIELVRTMVAEIDRPEVGDDRRIEVYYLVNSDVGDISVTVASLFPSRQADDRVIVTPQPSTNSLVVSAPADRFAQVDALLAELDAPPSDEDFNVRTIALANGIASDIATVLQQSLPESVKVGITPVFRSNAIMLTGSDEAIELAIRQIEQLDVEREVSSQEFKVYRLEHAEAVDLSFTLSALLRTRPRAPGEPQLTFDASPEDNTIRAFGTQDQLRQLDEIIAELDIATDGTRRTEFVRLEFALAEQTAEALRVFYGRFAPEANTPEARGVTIVADPASNSLVISADETEWPAIESLLTKLDNESYDTSRQLAVIPLQFADAQSVARALNESFRAQLDDRVRSERVRDAQENRRGSGRNGRDDDFVQPVLVDTEGVPSVSAEPQTNALIVSAGPKELRRIERIIEQLDVAEFQDLPEPTLIAVERGRPSELAGAIRAMFQADGDARGPRSVLVYGDDAAGTVVVRAEPEELVRIRALAASLQSASAESGVGANVLRVRTLPAARLRDTIVRTFGPIAQREGSPLTVEIDRASNALVVAATAAVFAQIEEVVRELDGPAEDAVEDVPGGLQGAFGPGQSVLIVDVENNAPEDIRDALQQLGATDPGSDENPGLVTDNVTLVPLKSRRALAVVSSPRDADTVLGLVRVLDDEPQEAVQFVKTVRLKLAEADAVVATLESILDAGEATTTTPAAEAVREHLRRLRITSDGFDADGPELDLSRPIRLVADEQLNAVVISSTRGNVEALASVVRTFDELPIGDAVVVRMFPLEFTSAQRARSIVEELFSRGEALRRVPGTGRDAQPATATGRALSGEIAASVDERTNTLIVAGPEEAVALVEVLVLDLDRDQTGAWIEPRVIELEHADADDLAETLRAVIAEGASETPEAIGLRRQFARLRVAGEGDGEGRDFAEADLYGAASGLIIRAESNLNALIVVGTAANVRALEMLVEMLDIEAASAGNLVRVYPLQFAAADRVAGVIRDVFDQRDDAGSLGPQDVLVLTADTRTNSLIAATSRRSFAVIESLLSTLDAEDADFTVGLHVLPVPDADVGELAPKIERLMRERIEAAQRAGGVESPLDTFSVAADEASGVLLLACSDENLQLVRELIERLRADQGALTQAERFAVIPLVAGNAEEVAQTIIDLYVEREVEKRGAGAVSVVADPRLNALVVSGTDADVNTIRGMVERFAQASPPPTDVKRIRLETADAFEVAQLLSTVLSGRAVGGGGTPAVRLRFFREQAADVLDDAGVPMAEAELDDLLRRQVRISPDVRTNSVLVVAPAPILELIEAIVADIDADRSGDRDVRSFRLENADAEAMQRVLQNLFNLQRQGDRLVLVPAGIGGGPDGNVLEREDELPFGLGASVTAVPDSRQELAITIDRRTNTVLVSGTAEYLDLVEKVINELDSIEANVREQFVVHLSNAQAEDVQTTLQSFFEDEADRLRSAFQGDLAPSLARQLENEVTVVGDDSSNKVLISVSPRFAGAVRDIVAELDAPPPQVMIQVLLAEVTLSDDFDFGVDFSVGGATGLGNDGFNGGSLAVGAAAAGVSSVVGAPNLSLASVDFELMVRALEAQGKLEILSRPQVTVKNNEPAVIQVGDDVGLITGTDQTDGGSFRSTVQREQLGIILEVTPTISPDGFVQMDVVPEISTLTSTELAVSEDFSTPVISRRRVSTTVSVMDGQTVVIGGLIQNTIDDVINKVPVLGDIPVVGALFRNESRSNRKTELLVVLTPKMIPGGVPAIARHNELSDQEIQLMTDPDRLRAIIRRPDQIGFGMSAVERGMGPDDSVRIDTPMGTALPGEVQRESPAVPAANESADEPADGGVIEAEPPELLPVRELSDGAPAGELPGWEAVPVIEAERTDGD